MNPVSEIRSFFENKKEQLQSLNLPRVWVDPGIGFGKTLSHNLELMRNLDGFTDDAWGVLLGPPENRGLITCAEHRSCQKNGWLDRICP